ncbi:type V CRISPR-associated protein Cas4 [Candidatus Dependentiae bacterium]|nr:type V CRISPR-associated protein Cas4 [Candidatus Dependentiae bacterium]
MEGYLKISFLNDFIFCPKSIYLHNIYDNFNAYAFNETPQIVGELKHKNIDQSSYSTRKDILQGLPIYSEKFKLAGKLDIFDKKKGSLIERKTKVKKVFTGYKYQLYAQYFCLKEMGFNVKSLCIYSLEDNKKYKIKLPDKKETKKFTNFIKKIENFEPSSCRLIKNKDKCANCIYASLCF